MQEFYGLMSMFKTFAVVVYVDPKDTVNFNRVLESMVKAKKNFPTEFNFNDDGSFDFDR